MEVAWEPLPGGWSGESYLARVADELQVVRIYSPHRARRARAAEVDAALFRLLRGLVPVPDVLEVRPEVDGVPGLLVTGYVDGVRAEDVVRSRTEAGDEAGLVAVGAALGHVAAVLAGIATIGPGDFVTPDLVPVPSASGVRDVVSVVEARPGRLAQWDSRLWERLLVVAHEVQAEQDVAAGGRTCLVHGDLVPRNIVLDPDELTVRAVVDLENAHSGSPYADLGSLVRFDRHPAWEEAVAGAWGAHRGVDPGRALHLARGADLASLVTIAARPGGNLVVDLADVFLREIAATGDLHAHP